jgi:hypothetical protein
MVGENISFFTFSETVCLELCSVFVGYFRHCSLKCLILKKILLLYFELSLMVKDFSRYLFLFQSVLLKDRLLVNFISFPIRVLFCCRVQSSALCRLWWPCLLGLFLALMVLPAFLIIHRWICNFCLAVTKMPERITWGRKDWFCSWLQRSQSMCLSRAA